MVTHFDEKGKFFTPVITKKPVAVIIQTITHRISGNIHIRPDERIKDELDRTESFIAVTESVIFDSEGKEIKTAKFVMVNRHQIVWVLPVGESANHLTSDANEGNSL
jgi:hypothetical protein